MKPVIKALLFCLAVIMTHTAYANEETNPLHPSYRPPSTTVNVQPITIVKPEAYAIGTVTQNPVTIVKPVINQTGYIEQTGVLKQNQNLSGTATTISGPATTNSGNITNIAKGGAGGSAYIENVQGGSSTNTNNVSVKAGSQSNTLNVAPGAVTANGGNVEKGAIQNTNNVAGSDGGDVNNSGNSSIAKGAVNVNIDNSQHSAAAPHAIATPVIGTQMAPVNPTSFYQAGLPNAVGADAVVGLYEDQCTTTVSGDGNVIHAETKYEKFTLVLDDQVKVRNGKPPTVQLVKLPQSTGVNSGRCVCLGTLQVEALPMPETGRGSNRQTLHVAALRFIASNLRLDPNLASTNVKLLYAERSITLNKGTEVYAKAKGFGGGGSATFGSNIVGALAPSFGSTGGYSTDYPMVGVTYFIVSDTSDGTPKMRTLDIARFVSDINRLPQPQWSGANAAPLAQAITAK